jgi:predicted enzyme related to lactoylglutathione lyase
MAARKPAKSARAKKSPSRSASSASTAASASRTTPAPRKKAAASQPLALSEASPSLTVGDLDASLAFYRDVLGFVVEQTWDEGGKVVGVSLRAGNVAFWLGQDDWKKGRIQSKGGRLDQGPTDQDWGVRDISLTDPDGFKITIANVKR